MRRLCIAFRELFAMGRSLSNVGLRSDGKPQTLPISLVTFILGSPQRPALSLLPGQEVALFRRWPLGKSTKRVSSRSLARIHYEIVAISDFILDGTQRQQERLLQ